MKSEQMFKILAVFFLEQFTEDAAGVGEWIANQDQNVDDFYNMVYDYAENSKTTT